MNQVNIIKSTAGYGRVGRPEATNEAHRGGRDGSPGLVGRKMRSWVIAKEEMMLIEENSLRFFPWGRKSQIQGQHCFTAVFGSENGGEEKSFVRSSCENANFRPELELRPKDTG